jgi:hypothetical protein
MRRAGSLAGFSATLAAATACSALVPELPTPPDAAGIPDGALSESAPGADGPNEVSGGDAAIDSSDASDGDASAGANDASEGGAPDADATARVPTFVQANSFASGTAAPSTLSATFTGAQTAGDLIVALVLVSPGNVSQTPTDTKGNPYHLAKHQTDSGGHSGEIYIWYAWNCAAATASGNTVTVSVPGSTYQDLIIEEWAKVQNSADPLDSTGGATALTGAPSCNASPTVAGVAIAGSVADHGQMGAGSGWTLRVQTTDYEPAIDQLVPSPGTITANTTPADDDWTIAAAVFKAQ